MQLRQAIQNTLDCLERPDHLGSRAHSLGSSRYSVAFRTQEFKSNFLLLEHEISIAVPKATFNEESASLAKRSIQDNVRTLSFWAQGNVLYRVELLRQVAHKLQLDFQDAPEEQRVYISDNRLLITVSRPHPHRPLDVSAILELQDNLVSNYLPTECKELRMALEKEDLALLIEIVRHMIKRGQDRSRVQASEMSKMEEMSEVGYYGQKLFEIGTLQGMFNFEVNPAGMLVYVLQLSPNGIAATAGFGKPLVAQQLPALLRTLSVPSPSKVLHYGSKKHGKSIGVYELEFKETDEESRDRFVQCPTFGRLEFLDRHMLKTQGMAWVKKQYMFNQLLMSCFKHETTANQDDNDEDEKLNVKYLYTVQILSFANGLWFKVTVLDTVYNVFVNTETLQVNVEDDEGKMDSVMEVMSAMLSEDKHVPRIIHFLVVVVSLRTQRDHAAAAAAMNKDVSLQEGKKQRLDKNEESAMFFD